MLILLTYVPSHERALMLNSMDEQGLGKIDFERINLVSCKEKSKHRHVELIKQKDEKRRLQQIEDAKWSAHGKRGTSSPKSSSSESESPTKATVSKAEEEVTEKFTEESGEREEFPMEFESQDQKKVLDDSLDSTAENELLESDGPVSLS